jgi:hypothetical protein
LNSCCMRSSPWVKSPLTSAIFPVLNNIMWSVCA